MGLSVLKCHLNTPLEGPGKGLRPVRLWSRWKRGQYPPNGSSCPKPCPKQDTERGSTTPNKSANTNATILTMLLKPCNIKAHETRRIYCPVHSPDLHRILRGRRFMQY